MPSLGYSNPLIYDEIIYSFVQLAKKSSTLLISSLSRNHILRGKQKFYQRIQRKRDNFQEKLYQSLAPFL